MANCKYCGQDTILYINGAPVCLDCSRQIEAGKKPPAKERPVGGSEKKYA